MNILVSKINWLGDMVVFLPTLRAVARLYPSAELILLCTSVGREVAHACVPRMEFIVVDKRDTQRWQHMGRALWKARAACRGKQLDLSLHSYDEPSFSYLLAHALRVPRRIGFESAIAKLQFLLTESVPVDRSRHVIDINYELVRHLGGPPAPERTPLIVAEVERQAVARKLSAVGIDGRFVALHGGAKLLYKEWGVANYLALAERLELELPVVVIEDGTRRFSAAQRLVETATVGELAALLGRAALFVGNNSGPMNVAAAMGTRCVVLEGPSPRNWGSFWRDVPYACVRDETLACVPCERLGFVPGRCLNSAYPNGCLKETTVDRVERVVWEVLMQ